MYLKLDIILVKNSHNWGCFSGPGNVRSYIVQGCKKRAKLNKIEKKGEGVFLVTLANFGKEMTNKLRKTNAKMRNNNNNNMQILIKRIKHPTDTPMHCCLLLRYQEYCHNHFASPRTCYWPSAHLIST